MTLCKACFDEKQYPHDDIEMEQEMGEEEKNGGEYTEGSRPKKPSRFEEKSLSKDYWDRIERDLKV